MLVTYNFNKFETGVKTSGFGINLIRFLSKYLKKKNINKTCLKYDGLATIDSSVGNIK